MVQQHAGEDLAITFDPSYISKSGKKTPGVGYFWCGAAGQAKWGLEIGELAAMDMDNHTAFHLDAVQTIDLKEDETLLKYYGRVILERKRSLEGSVQNPTCRCLFFQNNFCRSAGGGRVCGNKQVKWRCQFKISL